MVLFVSCIICQSSLIFVTFDMFDMPYEAPEFNRLGCICTCSTDTSHMSQREKIQLKRQNHGCI